MKIFPDKTQDEEFKDLGALGWTGSLNDRQFQYLRDAGYSGSLTDMLAAAKSGVSFSPPVPSFTGTMAETEDENFRYYAITSDGDLTFSGNGTVFAELVGNGFAGGSQRGSNRTGGGGASFPVSSIVDVLSTETYSVDLGTQSIAGLATSVVAPTNATALGLTALPGGRSGVNIADAESRRGGDGACGGGACHAQAGGFDGGEGSQGGDGAKASSDLLEAGAGGGAGGNAIPSTGVGVLSTPGPGVTSILGDTVCEGGATRLSTDIGEGADASTFGSGGQGISGGTVFNTVDRFGGDGGPARLVLRIPKAYEQPSIEIDAAPEEGWGYTLNEALTEAQVSVSGTVVSGSGSVVEVRAIEYAPIYNQTAVSASDWQELSVSGGAFSGQITVPVNSGRLQLEARLKGTVETFRQSGYWFTAIGVVFYGQSNTTLAWDATGFSETPQLAKPELIDELIAWEAHTNETVAIGEPADGGRQYALEMYSHTNIPMVFIWGGFPATGTSGLVEGSDAFTKLESAIGASNADMSTVHVIEVHQGENDTGDVFATWADDWEAIRASIADITGQSATNIKMQINALGTTTLGTPSDDNWTAMRYNQQQIASQGHTNTTFGTHSYQLVRNDEIHFHGGAYAKRHKIQARLMAWKLGFAANPGRFYISGVAKTSGTQTTLTLTHALGDDFTIETKTDEGTSSAFDDPVTTANITCFEVSTDGSTWTAIDGADVARASATTITLDHSDLGSGTRYIRYQYGANPNGAVVDNSVYEWPLEVTSASGIEAV